MDDTVFYVAIVPVAIIAGFVRGLTGFGGPILLIPALQLFVTPATSIVLALIADLSGNLRLIPSVLGHGSRVKLKLLTFASMIGIPTGIAFLGYSSPQLSKQVVSVIVLMSAIVLLFGWRLTRQLSQRELLVAGASGGICLGASGISIIVNLALQASNAPESETRATFIQWAFIVTIATLLMMAAFQGTTSANLVSPKEVLIASLAVTPAYLVGIFMGVFAFGRVNELLLRRFSLVSAAVLAIIGLT